MSDGKIVYQVRVDSSKVNSDLNAAGEKISAGSQTLTAIGREAAVKLGNALSEFFSGEINYMTNTLGALSGGFGGISSSANAAAGAIDPLTANFSALMSLDFAKLISFLTSFAGASNDAADAASSAAVGIAAVSSAQLGIASAVSSASSSGKYTLTKRTAVTPSSYRKGSEYIERDKYALLHKGEAVLTAAENQTLQRLGGVEGASLAMAAKTPTAILSTPQAKTETILERDRDINVSVQLDGYTVAKAVAAASNEMNRQLNSRIIK